MSRLLQLVCYASTLACVLLIGGVLGELSWQSKAYWHWSLGSYTPQPTATKFFQEHWQITTYLMLFPWLAFIGLPLVFKSQSTSYWDIQSFFLRLCTFILVEAVIILVILVSLFAPAAGILMAMPPRYVWLLDSCVQYSFWLCTALLAGLVIARCWRRKTS